jgi:hypothetical protein
MICPIVKKPFEENHCKKEEKYRLDIGVMNNEEIFITACNRNGKLDSILNIQ